MAHFGRTVDHRIERLQRRHQLPGGIDLNGQSAAGGRRDTVGQTLRADAEGGKILRPGRDHAPGAVAFGDGRRGKCGNAGAKTGKAESFDE